jgi:dolichol kinase
MEKETERQLFHMLIGCGTIAMLLVLGRGFAIAAVFFTIIVGLLLMNRRLLGGRLPLVMWFEEKFERPDAPFPGWGSACYAAGALIALTFLSDPARIAAVIFILAIGDGISTLAGRMGKIKLPHNPRKTLEGSVAFVLASLPAYYFIGPLVIPAALIGAVAESLPFEDNLTIPIACTALLLVL